MQKTKNERLKRQKSIGLHAPLNEGDTMEETIGCRRDNPGMCLKNSLEGVCAYVRSDGVCKDPPNSWKKQFPKLKSIYNKVSA